MRINYSAAVILSVIFILTLFAMMFVLPYGLEAWLGLPNDIGVVICLFIALPPLIALPIISNRHGLMTKSESIQNLTNLPMPRILKIDHSPTGAPIELQVNPGKLSQIYVTPRTVKFKLKHNSYHLSLNQIDGKRPKWQNRLFEHHVDLIPGKHTLLIQNEERIFVEAIAELSTGEAYDLIADATDSTIKLRKIKLA